MRKNVHLLRERIRAVVRRYKRSDMSARFDTSDIVQEVELQIWQQGLKEQATADDQTATVDPALLATVTRGHLSKYQRRHTAAKRSVKQESPSAPTMPGLGLDPQETVLFNDLTERVLDAINHLEQVDQRILHLRFFCSKQFKEIASELDLTPHQLRGRYERALTSVKTTLNSVEQ